jgi:hypothetical protein
MSRGGVFMMIRTRPVHGATPGSIAVASLEEPGSLLAWVCATASAAGAASWAGSRPTTGRRRFRPLRGRHAAGAEAEHAPEMPPTGARENHREPAR